MNTLIPSYRTNDTKDEELSALYNHINQDQKIDYACPWNRLRIREDESEEDVKFLVNVGDEFEVPFNQHFQRQLSGTLAPGLDRYGRELLERGENKLFADNHNRLLALGDGRKAQIRTLSNGVPQHARAFLSDAYRSIDDDVVFGEALPIIGEHKDTFQAIGGKRTDYKTYLKIVTREPSLEINSGSRIRKFHAGFILSNSEVGSGFAEFSAFLTDSFCNNGCIFSKIDIATVKFAHRGTRISTDFGEIMGSQIEKAKELEIRGLIQDATNHACDVEKLRPALDMMERAASCEITGDPIKVLEHIGNRVKLSKSEVEKVALHFYPDETNLLGVNSAITALAQECGSYERRIELEKAGAMALNLGDSKAWSAIEGLS